MDEILLAFIARTFNMSAEEVSSLLLDDDGKPKANADKLLLNKDKDRVKKLTGEAKQEGFDEAKEKTLSQFEGEIRSKYGLNSKTKGISLVEELVATKTAEVKGADGKEPAEPTEDQILRSKVHTEKMRQMEDAIKQKNEEWQEKWDARDRELSRAAKLSVVRKQAQETLAKLDPLLPKDPDKASFITGRFLDDLEKEYFDVDDDGKVLVVDEKNKLKKDAHGNPIKFQEFVKGTAARWFDFQTAKERESAGLAPGDTSKKPKATESKWTGAVPKDRQTFSEEFIKLRNAGKTADANELKKAFEAQEKEAVES